METKTFNRVASISLIIILAVAILTVIGISITGLYPGIIFLLLVGLVPIASKFFAKNITGKSNVFQRNYFRMQALQT